MEEGPGTTLSSLSEAQLSSGALASSLTPPAPGLRALARTLTLGSASEIVGVLSLPESSLD